MGFLHRLSVLGYHITTPARCSLPGVVLVGAVAVAGLGLLLRGARLRRLAARRGLKQSRRETAAPSPRNATTSSTSERPPARETPAAKEHGSDNGDRHSGPDDGLRSRLHPFGHRSHPRQDTGTTHQQSLNGQPVPDVPADEPTPAD